MTFLLKLIIFFLLKNKKRKKRKRKKKENGPQVVHGPREFWANDCKSHARQSKADKFTNQNFFFLTDRMFYLGNDNKKSI